MMKIPLLMIIFLRFKASGLHVNIAEDSEMNEEVGMLYGMCFSLLYLQLFLN